MPTARNSRLAAGETCLRSPTSRTAWLVLSMLLAGICQGSDTGDAPTDQVGKLIEQVLVIGVRPHRARIRHSRYIGRTPEVRLLRHQPGDGGRSRRVRPRRGRLRIAAQHRHSRRRGGAQPEDHDHGRRGADRAGALFGARGLLHAQHQPHQGRGGTQGPVRHPAWAAYGGRRDQPGDQGCAG